ncbi:alpha/beta hydrolase [Aldersonia sp. NBC_00410]|uniref:alpha/beta hydrolase n=1 Tax=Aldersonia sp. NBC_00410 TaxID=2975954 RepID=UPI002259766F|nr:alpha/beta hydrolase [Aldersonia sp. NBC_00410]MCX5042217.1 alpha/beta hydrolase [Aldersonia sp. NBC_00410]
MNPAGPSPQSRIVLELCRRVIRPAVRVAPVTSLGLRAAFLIEALAGVRGVPSGIACDRVRLPELRLEVVRPVDRMAHHGDGVVLYFHGGGFVACGTNTHRSVVAGLARRTGMPVINVEYRQLPKTNIAGSVRDCLTAYRWLLDQGADPRKVVFAGDSAGGFLVFATALKAIEEGLPRPAGLVGMSPLLDLDCADKFTHANAKLDAFVAVRGLAAVCRLGGAVDGVIDPLLSPVNGALAKLPPALLLCAEDEVLRCDAELMSKRLRRARVSTELQLWRGQVHAFPALAPNLPESRAALAGVARFIRSRTSPPRTGRGRIA